MKKKFLFVLALSALSSSVFAGYAQLVAPTNWAKTASSSVVRIAANDGTFVGGVRSGSALLNVGASFVTVPAAYRFAANASSIIGAAAFANPGLFLAAGAAAAYLYYTSDGLSVSDGVWKKTVETTGMCYRVNTNVSSTCYPSAAQAAAASASEYTANNPPWIANVTDIIDNNTPTGTGLVTWTYCLSKTYGTFTTTVGCYDGGKWNASESSVRDATLADFTGRSPSTIPAEFPHAFPVPNFEWPVEPLPIINPSADPIPVAQSLRVPQGEPVPVPNTSPQQWKTTVIDIVPSPTVDIPWRVDVQPREIVKLDPSPLPNSETVPSAPPSGTTESTPDPDLCAANPSILACANLGDPGPSDSLNKETFAWTFSPVPFAGSSACPSPLSFMVAGFSYEFSYSSLCDQLAILRYLFLAMAAFIAAWIVAAMFKV